MSRLYVILDVFADRPLAGNPLAVVLDAQGLDAEGMQAIAREFHLSETVFLLPAEDESRKARLRIFTPEQELPFAGHPTVGTAALLGLMDASAGKGRLHGFELEEPVGALACDVEVLDRRRAFASFGLARLPQPAGEAGSPAAIAAALGLGEDDIGFDRHAPSRFEAGNPFTFVPLNSRDALARAAIRHEAWDAAFGGAGRPSAYLYIRGEPGGDLAFRARMLRPGLGEDPATGSAVAAFAGVLMAFEPPADGAHAFRVGQGDEIGRPSAIELGIKVRGGALASATIGGFAVVAAEGSLFVK
ncbi:PhzF family phenazine biosynthesis protein [Methylopila musalis]|uniref:PhzF family phenazine biosynthesis protein n=1 Tax=Methylopila musalis TaxID=1134781 RepID=A0ABW3Z4P4_9HYPH